MAPILVPSSPLRAAKVSTQLQHGYEHQRHAALYGNLSSSNTASTSNIPEPVIPSHKSSFLASSAIAHRSAGSQSLKSNTSSHAKTFKRNVNSDFDTRAPVAATIGEQRDESLRLVETLPIGPKEVTPPDDDPHFLKFEPTSGIALRQRKVPHQEVVSHLEGRYYIPISTLYSVAVPERSDDGDYSIPVEGDWLTMGVIVKRSKILQTSPVRYDNLGQRLDKDGVPITDSNDPLNSQQAQKKASEKNGDAGQRKELDSRDYTIFTLLDISSQPDKFGQHDGSREIELAVYQSDSSWVEPGGQRKYFGGSSGAYEKLLMASYGTLVCILNPRVKKGYMGKKGPPNIQSKKDYWKYKEEQASQKGPTKMRLNARSGKTVVLVGLARDYSQCREDGCTTFVDKRMKTDSCDFHYGSRLEKTQNERPQLQSSWRMSTFGNQYSMANGMSGPKSRQFVLDCDVERDETLPGGKLYDVSAHLGRGKERRAEDQRLEKEAESRQAGQAVSEFRNHLSEVKLREKALLKMKKTREEQLEREENGRKAGILSNVMYESAGSRVIEASRKAVQERKRLAELDSDSKKGRKRVARQEIQVDQYAGADAAIPTGSYRATNGDVKVLSDISSKLLSRHSVKPSELSKPILLRRKKTKLPPAVRPPPGESFYAEESSDEEFNRLVESDAMNTRLLEIDRQILKDKIVSLSQDDDSDSDLEIIPSKP